MQAWALLVYAGFGMGSIRALLRPYEPAIKPLLRRY
jgi:hypothetical protein